MKIKWLLSFGFWGLILPNCFSPVYAEDLFAKYTHASFYWDGEAHGGKLILPLAEFRYYESADKVNENIGISWFSDKFIASFPCSIKAGNLTPGGLYSRMKSPLFSSTVTPFGSVNTEANCVTAKLPGYNSFNRPTSCYLQFGFASTDMFLRDFKISFYNSGEENIQVLSGLIKTACYKNLYISLSACSGYFDYSEKNNNSWFVKSPFYHKGVHFCSTSQLSVSLPFMTTLFTLGMFESPYGGFKNLYRLESKIKSGRFIFSLGGVYLPNTILTCDGTTESELAQIKCGIQGHWITGTSYPILVKAGLNSYCKINLTQQEHPFKSAAGVQFTFPITVLSMNAIIGSTIKNVDGAPLQALFNSFEFQLQNTWYIQNYTPTFSFSKSYTPSADFTSTTIKDSLELSILFAATPNITQKIKYEITKKDGDSNKQTFSTSISATQTIKKVTFTGKLSLVLKF